MTMPTTGTSVRSTVVVAAPVKRAFTVEVRFVPEAPDRGWEGMRSAVGSPTAGTSA